MAKPKLETVRHSASHVMAQAVLQLYPKAKLAIGPSIENGFYYDLDDAPVKVEDFPKIEKIMKKIIQRKLPFKKKIISKSEALKMFKDNKYKKEMIKKLKGKISIYTSGKNEFIDLCSGPHVKNTGDIKAFRLTKLAGAYWRGDEKNKMLTRIYGTAFPTQKELDAYIKLQEEAARRDHRIIGKQLDLFSFHEEGPGFPFFHPKGMVVINEILNYWKEEHEKDMYSEINTPIMLSKNLWLQSGHWDNYKEDMILTKFDNKDYAIKPMNCPGGILVYKSNAHSYKELPIRMAELGLVHRNERSGVLNGLLRVRKFTQDDAHLYCMKDQIEDEVIKILKLTDRVYKTFGFNDYHLELSTRPKKSIGAKKQWDEAEKILEKALKKSKKKYKINSGDGAFYGPKIDIHIRDCLGRTWQTATIQLDFQMPERFELTYAGKDNKPHRPSMIHRTVLGSLERFLALLIEHYAGAFPLWLAPVQVKIISFTDRNEKYARGVAQKFRDAGIRVEEDYRSESVQYKVRDAEMQKIPYIIVIGDKEQKAKTIAVRTRGEKPKFGVKEDSFINDLTAKTKKRL